VSKDHFFFVGNERTEIQSLFLFLSRACSRSAFMRLRVYALSFLTVLGSYVPVVHAQTEPSDRLLSPIVAAQRTETNGVHPLAIRQHDLGRVAGTKVFHRMVLLTERSAAQEADLEQLLQEQQDPSSPQYHQWLTPAEFGGRFGPSANDLAKITGWLQAQGFTVEPPANGRQFIIFTGSSAQVEAAFQTEIDRYSVNGKTYVANAKPASIPTALAPAVSGVASLNSFTQLAPQYHAAATPQIEIDNAALTGPADLSAIYDAAPLVKANVLGQGQSIALIEQSNIVLQDVTDFRKITGLPAATVNVIVNGADPGTVYGDETEAIADVEYAGALAPDATLNVVVTGSTDFNQGVDLSTAYAVDNDIAPIAALSYGGCETLDDTFASAETELYKVAWEQGAAEGISEFVAAGDYGGDTCGYLGLSAGYNVNVLGDSPWNVSVGGTEFIMPDANVYFPPPSYTAIRLRPGEHVERLRESGGRTAVGGRRRRFHQLQQAGMADGTGRSGRRRARRAGCFAGGRRRPGLHGLRDRCWRQLRARRCDWPARDVAVEPGVGRHSGSGEPAEQRSGRRGQSQPHVLPARGRIELTLSRHHRWQHERSRQLQRIFPHLLPRIGRGGLPGDTRLRFGNGPGQRGCEQAGDRLASGHRQRTRPPWR
jgi:hypothetical protein